MPWDERLVHDKDVLAPTAESEECIIALETEIRSSCSGDGGQFWSKIHAGRLASAGEGGHCLLGKVAKLLCRRQEDRNSWNAWARMHKHHRTRRLRDALL